MHIHRPWILWGGLIYDSKTFQAFSAGKGSADPNKGEDRTEQTPPGGIDPLSDSNVEMDWSTFAGEYSEIYEAIIRQRCINDGFGDDEKTLVKYFRLHLNRGINHYSTRDVLKNCSDLLKSAADNKE